MRVMHIFLAILVMGIWGFSFVAMDEGLRDTPPLLLCGLRFFLTTFPAIFFVKKPSVPWKIIASYGIFMFVLMFSFSFFSLHAGLMPGLASLLLQMQIFFTVILSAIFFKEKLTYWQLGGMAISIIGLIVVGMHMGGDVTELGLCLILAAALAWSLANMISKKAGKVSMVALIVWGSLFAWPLLFLGSWFFDGQSLVLDALSHLSLRTLVSLVYMAYPATIVGFSIWGWLLSRYKAGSVTPFALLVPFFGMFGSFLFFDESLALWKILAAFFVIAGLCVNLFGARLLKMMTR